MRRGLPRIQSRINTFNSNPTGRLLDKYKVSVSCGPQSSVNIKFPGFHFQSQEDGPEVTWEKAFSLEIRFPGNEVSSRMKLPRIQSDADTRQTPRGAQLPRPAG